MGLFTKRVKAIRLTGADALEDALGSGKPVFVDFWKTNCQPCRVMDGIVDELADEFRDDAVVVKAGLHDVPDLFARFKVRSTPTFVIVKTRDDGIHQRFRHSGLVKKDQLVQQIQRAVDSA